MWAVDVRIRDGRGLGVVPVVLGGGLLGAASPVEPRRVDSHSIDLAGLGGQRHLCRAPPRSGTYELSIGQRAPRRPRRHRRAQRSTRTPPGVCSAS